jgi:hypothetical protein
VENALNSWRSEIEKAGYHAVCLFFDCEPGYKDAEVQEEYVADALAHL